MYTILLGVQSVAILTQGIQSLNSMQHGAYTNTAFPDSFQKLYAVKKASQNYIAHVFRKKPTRHTFLIKCINAYMFVSKFYPLSCTK